MVRKRKSPRKTSWLFGVVVLGVLLIAGIYLMGSKEDTEVRTTPLLDIPSYLANADSLRGNIYKLEGTVSESLAWSPDSGRLIAVEVDENLIPVLVTPEFSSMNIQKELKLVFLLEVDENGILRTRKVNKS